MKNYEFTDCEQVLLFDLITQLSRDLNIDPKTGKHKLPPYRFVELEGVDLKVLLSLRNKFSGYLG